MGTGICTLHSGVHRNWQFLGTEAKEQTRNRDTIPRSGDADRVKGSFAGEGQGRERNWQDAQMWGGSMVRSSLSSPLAGICSSSLPLVPCRQALGECFLSVFSLKNFWSSNLLGLCLFFVFGRSVHLGFYRTADFMSKVWSRDVFMDSVIDVNPISANGHVFSYSQSFLISP